MKFAVLFAATVSAAVLSGCSGVSPTHVATTSLAATGGALLGHSFGKGNPLLTAAGAGAGVLLGETLQAGSKASNEKAYAAGYEKGRSDTAKQHYRLLIEDQRQPSAGADETVSLFDLPLPEREVDGAILTPGIKTLRIQE
jgi:uncharacterized protein YcfJ